MHIGPHHIDNPLALAPMVGVTDKFFRRLCRDLGAGYVVSEMLAADPALRDTHVARLRGDFVGEAGPVAVQIAGSEPAWMAEAARYNVARGAQIIDINMGCPAKKVCNKLAGSALLSQPGQVRAILEAVVAAVAVPVTLKIRTGPNPQERNGVEIARLAEDAGIAALAVHGRTRSDRFTGGVEYATIRAICEAVAIPVFANGDIESPEKAAAVLELTGADGLMIGRAAQGNPWIFREVRHYLAHGERLAAPTAEEVLEVMERHLAQLHRSYGEAIGVRVARKHIGWYLDGRPGAERARRLLLRAESAAEQFGLLRACFEEPRPDTERAPQRDTHAADSDGRLAARLMASLLDGPAVNANPFKARFPEPKPGPDVGPAATAWTGLHGSALALAIHAAATAHDGITLVAARSSHQAQLLARDIELLSVRPVPVWLFPDHETLPYDPFSPHPDIIAERLRTLAALGSARHGILLAPTSSLMQRLPPAEYILQRSFDLAVGQTLAIEAFRRRLQHAGYESAEQVYQSGQYAIRGSVIDLFPAGSSNPYRLDLFDEELESIRLFDPESQRSTGKVERITLLPAREYPCDDESLEAFRRAFRYRFAVDTRNVNLYQDLRAGVLPQGLEQYLPLFHERTSFLLDYLQERPQLVLQDGFHAAAEDLERRTGERWEQRRHDVERPVLEPAELFFGAAELRERLAPCPTVLIGAVDSGGRAGLPSGSGAAGFTPLAFAAEAAPDLHIHERGREPAATLLAFLDGFPGRVLFAADTPGRREVLRSTLAAFGVQPADYESFAAFHADSARLGLAVLPVEEGFLVRTGEAPFALITESQLFGGRTRPKVSRGARGRPAGAEAARDPESIIRNLTDLAAGAPVVHEDHGVGRYSGLETLEIDGRPAEFLMLEYADGDKLYVPVSSLHLVSRYTGSDPDSAPLHRLGSRQWEKAKRKAAEQVCDVAAELLDLYARRLARDGFAFPLDEKLYAEFASGFPWEETPDQQAAIDAVLGDLASPMPMDRVVCGDVGFGKTEVALRAAFVAVQAGRQVALLVPTTLLAQQHFATFSDRLADWPVRVELLSRFRTDAQLQEVLQRLEQGRADIVIGTHRLLQRDVRFRNLGLVIIDEEQRFGVQQKERLKRLRAEVDLLTLTATPIPRTLNMAMSGIRDLSIIATPPARRMAVKTVISEWDRALLREALLRELQRGGQVFFLHNEVRSIERIAREVQELAPQARLAVAHGQLPERDLERIMLDFYRQRYNVLVCTTIIESGLDVPTANTIVINRADRFGLAQLHQLRGRVGRSHHRAYAYLVVPERRSLTPDARKRLEAIAALEELGAGLTLATHDLEIRGAGELLGVEQSGQINQVGFSLYSDMLARAVAALQNGREPELDAPLHRGLEIELHVPALIPERYLGDVQARLTLYKRIASARDSAGLRELQVEMIDRFGLLPEATKNLFAVAELRLLAERVGVTRLDYGPQGGRVEFLEQARADPAALIRSIQESRGTLRMDGPRRLRILDQQGEAAARFRATRALLERLQSE